MEKHILITTATICLVPVRQTTNATSIRSGSNVPISSGQGIFHEQLSKRDLWQTIVQEQLSKQVLSIQLFANNWANETPGNKMFRNNCSNEGPAANCSKTTWQPRRVATNCSRTFTLLGQWGPTILKNFFHCLQLHWNRQINYNYHQIFT